MRAEEFIIEGGPPRAKMKKDHADATSQGGSMIARDAGGYDRTYHMNRLWMAAACADGSNKKIEMNVASPTEKFNSINPYTELEHKMMKQAMKTVPGEYHTNAKPGKSSEPKDTHKTSPVQGFKGFK